MHKVVLCLQGGILARNAIPKIIGRSGHHYACAYYNEKTQQHESEPLDLEFWNTVARPDIAKVRGQLPWLADVRLGDENAEVARLTQELHEARAHIALLESAAKPAVKAEASAWDALPASVEESIYPSGLKTFRELRQAVKDRGIPLPAHPTYEDLVALLASAESTPAVQSAE